MDKKSKGNDIHRIGLDNMKNTNYINRLIHSNNLLSYLIITFIFVIFFK